MLRREHWIWQTLGIYHSHKKSGQHGPVTRLLSCTEEKLKIYKDVEGIPTHIAPSWTIHPKTGDVYRHALTPFPALLLQDARSFASRCGASTCLKLLSAAESTNR